MGLISRPRTSAHWYAAIRDHVNKHGLAVISLDEHGLADQIAIGRPYVGCRINTRSNSGYHSSVYRDVSSSHARACSLTRAALWLLDPTETRDSDYCGVDTA